MRRASFRLIPGETEDLDRLRRLPGCRERSRALGASALPCPAPLRRTRLRIGRGREGSSTRLIAGNGFRQRTRALVTMAPPPTPHSERKSGHVCEQLRISTRRPARRGPCLRSDTAEGSQSTVSNE